MTFATAAEAREYLHRVYHESPVGRRAVEACDWACHEFTNGLKPEDSDAAALLAAALVSVMADHVKRLGDFGTPPDEADK